MKKTKLLGTLALVGLLSSCNNYNYHELSFKILCPVGAPTAAFYPYFNDSEHFETASVPTNVRDQFLAPSSVYSSLVFDSLTGMTLIKGKNAPFKLAKIITKGNFFVLSLNGDNDANSDIPETAKILSFGEGGTPDLIFKHLYPNLQDQVTYVAGVEMVFKLVSSGQNIYEGEQIDYVFISEPYVSRLFNDDSLDISSNVCYKYNIQEKWHEKSGLNGFPQAGLFVQSHYYENNKEKFDQFLTDLDHTLNDVVSNPSAAIDSLKEFGNENEQFDAFGITETLLSQIQGDNKNYMGFANEEVDIRAYYDYMGLGELDESLFIDGYFD